MSSIPKPTDSTLSRIWKAWQDNQKPRFSKRLGASQIGKECKRAAWYAFRWAKMERFDGRMLRLFDTGHLEEDRIIIDLKMAGVDVKATDPETGKQWEFNDVNGHFVCRLDAAAQGFIEAPATWHVCEFKTMSQKAFDEIAANGCQKAKPEYFCQVMTGMGMSGMERAALLCVNKNTDDIYIERIRFDKKEWTRILQLAKEIIFGREAPERIGTGPAYFQCKWCAFHGVCHGEETAAKNCRTCIHSTPTENGDGEWVCEINHIVTDHIKQAIGCPDHEYRKEMTP
jgi:hypothetical protein